MLLLVFGELLLKTLIRVGSRTYSLDSFQTLLQSDPMLFDLVCYHASSTPRLSSEAVNQDFATIFEGVLDEVYSFWQVDQNVGAAIIR